MQLKDKARGNIYAIRNEDQKEMHLGSAQFLDTSTPTGLQALWPPKKKKGRGE